MSRNFEQICRQVGRKSAAFYALIKQGEKIEWNEEADRAFEHLK
jgi:hypothetical protein